MKHGSEWREGKLITILKTISNREQKPRIPDESLTQTNEGKDTLSPHLDHGTGHT